MTKKTSIQREHLTADAIEKKLLASESTQSILTPEQVVLRYGELLNQKKIDEIIDLYHQEAEIIPDQLQSLSGKEAIIEFYKNTFNTIELHGELKIQSIDLDHNLAIVRCEEPGDIKDLDSGLMIKSYFREIFLLKRIEEQWRIYRYMFSQNPAQAMA